MKNDYMNISASVKKHISTSLKTHLMTCFGRWCYVHISNRVINRGFGVMFRRVRKKLREMVGLFLGAHRQPD